jgi:Protein of Unknown function (DUF2784)
MVSGLYRAMAASVLLLHAAYIAWVILGAFFTRGRPRLAVLHVATLVYSVIIEIFGFWCPLTTFETWLDMRGGVSTYRGPFLVQNLDAVVYPNIPPKLLIAGAVAVCVLNLWIYARRVRVRPFTRMKTRLRRVRTGDVRVTSDGFSGAFSSESLVFIKLAM